MLSARIISFIVFLIAFGTLVCAGPVASAEVSKREAANVAKRATANDVIAILKALQDSTGAQINTLNALPSTADPTTPATNIAAALNNAVLGLLALGPITGLTTALLAAISQLLAAILIAIADALGPFVGGLPLKLIVITLDLAINLVLITVNQILFSILALVAALITNLPIWKLIGLVTSIGTLGL
ncbi:hypothetical protein BOTBODRAFT_185694 [Botryobasidium botryosum FD-172 SS1]|uniref:TRP C-terminal domain-containing protein n=1 Tax=Botryobasidium botryosum (strain FD-172 SS1) TaxID=930990 RepID=A0A067N046_BOTB1|nr:hypothetical protein BOTBODRAFT_185694 [Botryobasidium botryosum FD-172 SS1]